MWEHVRKHASRSPADLALADPQTRLSWGELVRAVVTRSSLLPDSPRGRSPLIALHRPADVAWVVDLLALHAKGYAVLAVPESMPGNAATALAGDLGAVGILSTGAQEKITEHRGGDLKDTALVHLTSGTTGTARGVLRSAANLHDEAAAVADALTLNTAHAVLMGTPVTHSFASGMLFAALVAGAPGILVPRYDPAAMAALALHHRPGIIAGTPYVLRALAGTAAVRRAGLPGLRHPLSGGAPLHPSWADLWLRTTGVRIRQEYGLSEGGIATMNLRHAEACPESVGTPVPRVEIRVLDADGRPAAVGTEGRIVVDRPANPTTYLSSGGRRQPIPALGDGTLRGLDTGDLGFVDHNGLLHLTGRAKLLINVAGAKVSPVEVEQRLLDHPSVNDAVVVGVPDPDRGEAVAAMVETSSATTVRELADHVRQHLNSYAVPRRWAMTDTVPRTPAGKPDRARIRHLLEG
ncbi:class I adenylate-forming enzyme family protein [Streptomyces sp. NPDC059627]